MRFVVLLIFFLSASIGANLNKKRVLYLNSYNPGFPTFFDQCDGVNEILTPDSFIVDIEFMDTKRFNEKEDIVSFKSRLKRKLDDFEPYDLILVSDDNGLKFVDDYYDSLFVDKPIIFFGINNIDYAEEISNRDNFTGVVEAVSMRETVDMMTGLFPNSDTLYTVVDNTSSGKGDLQTFLGLKRYYPDKEFVVLSTSDMDFDDLKKKLKKIDKNSPVLLLSLYNDVTGKVFTFWDGVKLIVENTKAPVFHLWYHGMGEGLFGGKLISQYDQAITASKMAKKVLTGSPVSSLKLVKESPNKYYFDYGVADRFNIDLENFPKETVFMNYQISDFEKHLYKIIFVVSTILGLGLILIYLIYLLNRVKKSEIELFKSLNKLRLILDSAYEGFFILHNDICLETNRRALDLFEIEKDDIIGKKLDILLDYSELIRTSESSKFTFIEKKCYTKNGKPFFAELRKSWISSDEYELTLITVIDVTEIKKLNDEKLKIKELESLGVLAGGLAHNFNNLHTIIYGNLALIHKHCRGNTAAMYLIDNISDTLSRARNLTNQLLTFSKGGSPMRSEFDVIEAITETAEFIISDSKIKFRIINSLRDKIVYLDKNQFIQVISNLLNNSIKACNNEGQVIVRLDYEDIEGKEFLKLSFEDNGSGIEDKIQNKIYDPYFSGWGGLGLGLSTVHSIVYKHDGFIELNTKVDKGTEFLIFLPKVYMFSQQETKIEKKIKLKVLVLEDEAMVMEVARIILEEELNHEVVCSYNGEEAVMKYKEVNESGMNFDVCMVDLTLKDGIDGLEAVRKMREISDQTIFILCSGYYSDDIVTNYTKYGFSYLLKKPYPNDELRKLFSSIIDEFY
ncbi:MAG: response regulator [Candidatus Delongbacteria bacterium]|nr:response regulator [Candidatus Delongbacteria bacterium]MBN2833750.1 response regulator [Candidatus Delongbacteria bacterium]